MSGFGRRDSELPCHGGAVSASADVAAEPGSSLRPLGG